MTPIFDPTMFTATQWSTAKDKAEFATWLIRFIEKGAPLSLFHKAKYNRLSMCFGHIAHYNKFGFHDEWFQTPEQVAEWVRYITSRPVYGDPAWTFSDVERVVVEYARQHWV